jgi:V/A-type H+/Na+-transporting ATPase subunit I
VLMRNRRLARPFEFLVRFLDLPRAGTLDPTVLMAVFLPLMVGVMVGDVVYGTLLLVIALFVRRR